MSEQNQQRVGCVLDVLKQKDGVFAINSSIVGGIQVGYVLNAHFEYSIK